MSASGSPGFRPRFFVSQAAAQLGAANQPELSGRELALSPEDAYHARTVLRLQPGDLCEVVVGAAVYAASVRAVGDPVIVRLDGRLDEEVSGAVYRVKEGLVQAIARPAVMDFVFEKGTEVGTSFFLLVAAVGSPKWASSPERMERWNRIVREAAKQSKQVAVPPVLFAVTPADGFLHPALAGARSFVLDPRASSSLDEVLCDRTTQTAATPAVALWIGPEGGWSASEVEQFEAAGVIAVRLGRAILRTETAGPVAVAIARVSLGDW